jgi:hypothetical protein
VEWARFAIQEFWGAGAMAEMTLNCYIIRKYRWATLNGRRGRDYGGKIKSERSKRMSLLTTYPQKKI